MHQPRVSSSYCYESLSEQERATQQIQLHSPGGEQVSYKAEGFCLLCFKGGKFRCNSKETDSALVPNILFQT